MRHPGVTILIERDFKLMRRGAALLSAMPLVGSPAIKESVMQVCAAVQAGRGAAVLGSTVIRRGVLLGCSPRHSASQPHGPASSPLQFGAPLREQLDLVTEAAHLDAFGHNFRHWSGVSFPLVGVLALLGGVACGGVCARAARLGCLRGLPCLWPHLLALPLTPLAPAPPPPAPDRQPADAPLVSSEVLVETFEEGELISK